MGGAESSRCVLRRRLYGMLGCALLCVEDGDHTGTGCDQEEAEAVEQVVHGVVVVRARMSVAISSRGPLRCLTRDEGEAFQCALALRSRSEQMPWV